ncbi:hypothetical protein ABK040_008251 [Willaertia magna]
MKFYNNNKAALTLLICALLALNLLLLNVHCEINNEEEITVEKEFNKETSIYPTNSNIKNNPTTNSQEEIKVTPKTQDVPIKDKIIRQPIVTRVAIKRRKVEDNKKPKSLEELTRENNLLKERIKQLKREANNFNRNDWPIVDDFNYFPNIFYNLQEEMRQLRLRTNRMFRNFGFFNSFDDDFNNFFSQLSF